MEGQFFDKLRLTLREKPHKRRDVRLKGKGKGNLDRFRKVRLSFAWEHTVHA
jgi:hypothetical protein